MDPMNTRTSDTHVGSEGFAETDPLLRDQLAHDGEMLDSGTNVWGAKTENLSQSAGAGFETMDATAHQMQSGGEESSNGQSGTGQIKEKASELAGQAGQKAEAGMHKSADGLKKAAEKARSVSEDRSGTVGSIGTQAADALDKGAGYLGQGDTEQMIQDLESLVRKRPVESLLVAMGVGFVVSKAMR